MEFLLGRITIGDIKRKTLSMKELMKSTTEEERRLNRQVLTDPSKLVLNHVEMQNIKDGAIDM